MSAARDTDKTLCQHTAVATLGPTCSGGGGGGGGVCGEGVCEGRGGEGVCVVCVEGGVVVVIPDPILDH